MKKILLIMVCFLVIVGCSKKHRVYYKINGNDVETNYIEVSHFYSLRIQIARGVVKEIRVVIGGKLDENNRNR